MDERLVEAAQALLTGYDTALSRQWREEERAWRAQDLEWRQREAGFMELQGAWRSEDVAQRQLDNARVLWGRILERNRRDVEEKTEQLKAISTLAALISGFALTAFLQFDFGEYKDTSGAVFPIFGISMALTVGLETLCVVICSLMLVSVIKTGKRYVSDEQEADFMARCRQYIAHYRPGDRPPAPKASFATHWAQRCEQSWRRAFLAFALGIPTLFLNLAVAAFIKFDTSLVASVATSAFLGLSLLVMWYFHRKWARHILDAGQHKPADALLLQELSRVPAAQELPWAWHARPAAAVGSRPGLLPSLGAQGWGARAAAAHHHQDQRPSAAPSLSSYAPSLDTGGGSSTPHPVSANGSAPAAAAAAAPERQSQQPRPPRHPPDE